MPVACGEVVRYSTLRVALASDRLSMSSWHNKIVAVCGFFIAALIFLLFFPRVGWAAPASSRSFLFRHVGIEAGLSGSRVSDLMVDGRGFVWASTIWGLDQYDGYEVSPAYVPDSLQGEVFSAQELGPDSILIKMAGRYAIYSRSRMAFSYANAFFDACGAAGPVDDAWVDGRQNLWMLCGRKVRVVPYANGGKGAEFLLPDDCGVSRACRTNYGVAFMLSNGCLLRCYAPTDGNMPAPQSIPSPLASGCRKLKCDFDGNLWVLSANGDSLWFRRQAGKEWTLVNDMSVWSGDAPRSFIDMAADSDGRMWLASERDGLYVIDFSTGRGVPIRRASESLHGLRSNRCTCVTSTPDGFVLVGYAFSGFSIYHPSAFQFGSIDAAQPGLRALLSGVTGIVTNGQSTAYAGTEDYGLLSVNIRDNSVSRALSPEVGSVDCMAYADGGLWLGLDGRGVARLNAAGGLSRFDSADAPLALRGFVPARMAAGASGGLWVACADNLAYLPSPGAEDPIEGAVERKLPELIVGVCSSGSEALVLLRSRLCKASVSDGRMLVESLVSAGLADLRPVDIWQGADSVIWVAAAHCVVAYAAKGAGGGLAEVGRVGMENPLAMSSDEAGNVVVASPSEVCVLRVNRSSRGWSVVYERRDAPSYLGRGSVSPHSACLMPDGDIWFGAERGIIKYSPATSRLSADTLASRVAFCSVTADGETVRPGDRYDDVEVLRLALPFESRLLLPVSSDVFTVHFSALGVPSQSVVYVCDVEGSDLATVYTREPCLTLHNLPAGTYTLRVRIQGEDGGVSALGASLEVVVREAWRESVYAKGFMLFAALLMAVMITYCIMSYRNAMRMNEMAKAQADMSMSAAEVGVLRNEALVDMASDITTSLSPLADDVRGLGRQHGVRPEERIKIDLLCDRLMAANTMLSQVANAAEVGVSPRPSPVRHDLCAYVRQVCDSVTGVTQGTVRVDFSSSMRICLVNFDAAILRYILVDVLSDAVVSAQCVGFVNVRVEKDKYMQAMISVTISMGGAVPVRSRYFAKADGSPSLRGPVKERIDAIGAVVSSFDGGDGVYFVILQIPAGK